MNKNRIMIVGGGVAVALLLLAVCAGLVYKNFGPHKRKPAVAVSNVAGGLAPLPAPGSTGIGVSAPALPPATDITPASAVVVSASVDAGAVQPVSSATPNVLPAPAAAELPAPAPVIASAPAVAPVTTPAFVASDPSALPAPAVAEHRSVRATVFDTIDQINTDNALLNAQIAHENLKKALADAVSGHDPAAARQQSTAFGGQPLMPNSIMPVAAAAANSARGAFVAQVTTSPLVNGGAPTADVVLPSGGHVAAKVGTRIPNLGVVDSVSIQSVQVNDGKRTITLPFESEADASMQGSH